MTTIKEQIIKALVDGDTVDEMVCMYQDNEGEWYSFHDNAKPPPIIQCSFHDLPERDYDSGYGGTNGAPFIGFTPKHVYISVQYDGAEWVEAIPRNPDSVKDEGIPWPGGG